MPHPRSFFAGFVLEQMVPLHEVRQFFSSRLYKAAATTRMVKLSLAINEWQSDHEGALPERLEQLVPRYIAAIPADPFDGKPVRYHRDWRWLWCVGPDLKDDTGKLKRKEDRAAKDDDEVMPAGRFQ
ncbi:MAG TPA: hypothetical protein VG796_08490 [Verrucomicrobiales bacterium]|nr:hypothetical protein [Verrucomicrobiales bacterium]